MQQIQPSLPSATVSCGFCGYEIPAGPVRTDDGVDCCSEHCRTAYESGKEPFTDRVGFKRFRTGVSVLDGLLPRGMPTNSFVLLAGEEGIRHRGLQTELVWRALQRGEPAVVITFVDPPVAVVEHFFTFGWNVLPYLESGQLHVVDCFTDRLREKHQIPTHQIEWNEFLREPVQRSVTLVRDTGDLKVVEDKLHERLVAQGMVGTGLVVIDSLNEVELQGHEFETEQFIKEVRGDICSRRFVPIFASTTTDGGTFTHEHAYLFDGIVRMRRTAALADGTWTKELSVRKMDGVPYRSRWSAYGNLGRGFQPVDRQTESPSTTAAPPASPTDTRRGNRQSPQGR